MDQQEQNKIIHGDCVDVIPELVDNSIDLMVTSPPYNVNKEYNEYNDNMEFDEYISWLHNIFSLLKPKMKDDGRLVINIGDRKNGLLPTHYYIINFMFDIGYSMYTTIMWYKQNTSKRTSWGSFKSPSCPSFPTPFEYILIFYNKHKKKQTKGETDLTKDEFIKNSLAIWEFNGTTSKKSGHPAAFPEELPKRCIKQLTWIGDTVLDIFGGSGTTGIVSKKLNRKSILIEKDKEYVDLTKKKMSNWLF